MFTNVKYNVFSTSKCQVNVIINRYGLCKFVFLRTYIKLETYKEFSVFQN